MSSWPRIPLVLALVSALSTPLSVAAQNSLTPPDLSATARAYAEFATQHPGNAASGKELFASETTACANCHSIDGTSTKSGPDLSGIGDKFPRSELIRSILEPSATIAIGYANTTIETTSGTLFQGVVKRTTREWTELMGADSQLLRIASTNIQEQRVSSLSLMPEGLHAALSREQFADLIAFLESLRHSTNIKRAARGKPDSIPLAAKSVRVEPFFSDDLKLNRPTWFGEVPGRSNLFIVLEGAGKVWRIERSNDKTTHKLLLDLSPRVRFGGGSGMLACLFHPDFAANQRYYLKYQVTEDGQISTIVVERRFTPDLSADAGVAREILKIPCATQDHTGGALEFGPDGFLYIGMGDSGPQRDPQGHGQSMTLLLGKILRIDVNRSEGGKPYAIPENNPFRGLPHARPEIWALGFREPWRFSFDPVTGDLWVGDVGQDRIEEITIARAGENHGWNVYEGFDSFSDQYRRPDATYIPPVFAYPRSSGASVTGGYVYRGKNAPHMNGWYIFADFESRRIWALTQTNRTLERIVEIGRAPDRVVSFTQDRTGELHFVGYDSGVIYRLHLDSVDPTPLRKVILASTAEHEAVNWRYTLTSPTEDWMAPDFDDSSWIEAPAGFGTRGTPGAIVRTEWRTRDIWLRRKFTLPEEALTGSPMLALRLHHDEDVAVHFNGIEAMRLPRWTTGYTELPLTDKATSALRPGLNVVAIHCRQNGGGQYIDAGLIQYVHPEVEK